jgi:hypothetical protein
MLVWYIGMVLGVRTGSKDPTSCMSWGNISLIPIPVWYVLKVLPAFYQFYTSYIHASYQVENSPGPNTRTRPVRKFLKGEPDQYQPLMGRKKSLWNQDELVTIGLVSALIRWQYQTNADNKLLHGSNLLCQSHKAVGLDCPQQCLQPHPRQYCTENAANKVSLC